MATHSLDRFIVIFVSVLASNGFMLDGPALPNRPFITVWNVPSGLCDDKFGIKINVSHFDIVQNPNDHFAGEFVTIFYSLGLFPHLMNDEPINGGIPQLGNLTLHLEIVWQQIVANLPDPSFRGLAVIDFEAYKPIWEEDWDYLAIYKNLSRELVHSQHPDWPDDQIESEAKRQFETAAKTFMLETLLLAVRLRPNGHWGYYHYPYCFDYDTMAEHCRDRFKELNDEERWLFKASQALYPSIYLHGNHPAAVRPSLIHAILEEAFRVARNRTNHLPVFSYTKFQYNDRAPCWFYTETDIAAALRLSADFGSAGSVVWSSSNDFVNEEGCLLLQAFMDKIMGPLVRSVTAFTVDCSRDMCEQNGRCVRKIYYPYRSDSAYQSFEFVRERAVNKISRLKRSLEFTPHTGPYADYKCDCYHGWGGEHCEIPKLI